MPFPSASRKALGTLVAGGLLLPIAVASQERSASSERPPQVVAILHFDNHTGNDRYDALGKGMAEMLITDLSGLPFLRLVERARLQDLVDEMALSQSEYSDSDTALEIGRILAAEYVVTGAFVSMEEEFRVDTRVIETETSEIVKTAQARGTDRTFFLIQEQIADALIEGLEIALLPEERQQLQQRQEENRIDDVETVLAYSEALDLYDRGEVGEAALKMAQVVNAAPNSMIVQLTYEHMRDAARDQARDAAQDEVRDQIRRRIPRPRCCDQ